MIAVRIIFSFLFLYTFLLLIPNTDAHSAVQIVKMNSNGFEPQTVEIDTDSAVIFLNEDSQDRWPASNIHPTHDIYPEFDPQKALEPGESWSFKPKRVGSYKYHDHLLPHLRGTLVVTSEVAESSSSTYKPPSNENLFANISNWFAQLLDSLKALFSKRQVLGISEFKSLKPKEQFKALDEIAKSKSSQGVWDYFKQGYGGESGTEGNVHDLAHHVGKLIYEHSGFSGITICTTEFAFGCYHGFLDKAFQDGLDKLSEAEEACRAVSSFSGPFGSCIHGIGHGVASFYQTNDIRSSILTCQKLTQGSNFCYDGVLMEFSRGAPEDFYSKDNPYYPCDVLEGEFGSELGFACGRNQAVVLASRFILDFNSLVQVCLNSPSQSFQMACFDAIGFELARNSSDSKQIITSCQQIGVSEFTSRCAKAAAGELIFQDRPSWREESPSVCQSLELNYQQDCLNYLNQLKLEYQRD